MDFIENKNMLSYDDSAQSLIKEMENNEAKVKELIGEKAFEEEMRVLKLIAAEDEKKGNFA
jgi:ABC-type transport system involved in cytochrome bd biosynthesis fused ATPase/permease subunit